MEPQIGRAAKAGPKPPPRAGAPVGERSPRRRAVPTMAPPSSRLLAMKRDGGQASHELLDDPGRMRSIDVGGMLARLAGLPSQLEQAWECGRGAAVAAAGAIDKVVLCGMGGSAIGADLLTAWLGDRLTVPLLVSRTASVPAFLDPSTLAVVCSYSGNTGETLAACEQACGSGALVACVCSNGELERRARGANLPLVSIPPGSPPRAAVAFTTIATLQLLNRAGVAPDCGSEVAQAAAWLSGRVHEYGPEFPLHLNPAKRLAVDLFGKLVVVYGSQGRLDGVARRWAGQFSENAKQLSFSGSIPEMTHNEIVGWMGRLAAQADLAAVFLQDSDDLPSVQAQSRFTRELLGERVACLQAPTVEAPWPCRLWDLVLLGDYASVYLAFLNGEDPTPVRAIDSLKERMKELEDVASLEKGK